MRHVSRFILAVALVSVGVHGETANVKTHVTALASEEMEGRQTGTEGARRASDYIIGELSRLGVLPLPGQSSFRVSFDFTSGEASSGK